MPNYPDASRIFWQVIDKRQVEHIFYTAPTAIALMREGDTPTDLGTGNPAPARLGGRADQPGGLGIGTTRWSARSAAPSSIPGGETETGEHPDHPVAPGATALEARARRPARSSACSRCCSTRRARKSTARAAAYLAIKASWPSQIRSVYGDHQRMIDTYFKPYPGYYFSGDGARDEDGYYLDHRPGRRRNQCLRTPDRHRRVETRWSCTMRWPGGDDRLPA